MNELPREIIYHILKYCYPSALVALGKTNFYLRSVYLMFMNDMTKEGVEKVIMESLHKKLMYTRLRNTNKFHGQYIRYYTQYRFMKPWWIKQYFNGMVHGPEIGYYGSNGMKNIINTIEYYQDGIKSGPSYEYYPNGWAKKYELYKNGLPDGLLVEWISTVDNNGKCRRHYISRKVRYKEGKRHGIEYRADYLSPNLKPFGVWINGKLIHRNSCEYDPINRLTKTRK